MSVRVTLSIHDDGAIEISTQPTPAEVKLLQAYLKAFKVTPSDPFIEQFITLWNEYAERNSWSKIKLVNKDLKDRLTKAYKDFPSIEDWRIILRGMEADPFFSGKSGKYLKPKARTLFYNSRYFVFHEDGSDLADAPPERTVDDILAGWRSV